MLSLKKIMRGMTNCYEDEKRDGKMDYSFFRPNTITPFSAGIDQGYFAEGIDGVGYIFICGTNNIPTPTMDWWSDFDTAFNSNDANIKSHRGFTKGFISIKEFAELLKGYPTKCIAGHSRGGAIATLFARHIRHLCRHSWCEKNSEIICITAGSPKVYNVYGACEFDLSGIMSIRMRYRSDLATYFPFGRKWRHVDALMQLGGNGIIPWAFDHYPTNYIDSLH